MSLYNFSSYRAYLDDHIVHLPQKGRGEIKRMSQAIQIHPTLMSMILSGSRDLTSEQAFDLSNYLQHTEMESDYFLALVQLERAGNQRLKSHLKKNIEKIKTEATKISNRFEHERKLTDEERAVFYSTWIYSAIRLYCSTTEQGKTLSEIATRFDLPRQKISDILDFLKSTGLVTEEKDHFQMGISRTFLEHGSPHLPRHHMNWRVKSMQKVDRISEKELMFTFPLSISKNDFDKIREELAEVIKKVSNIVKDSPAEEIGCLNMDLFWIEK
jgi:uncharacterized protein (TIGR02147 family)